MIAPVAQSDSAQVQGNVSDIKALGKVKREDKSHFVSRGKKLKYLVAFCKCARHDWSALASGVVTRTHYDWLRDDPDYVTDFEAAKEAGTGSLENKIIHRGFYADNPNALLAIFQMKKLNHEYRDNFSVDINHKHELSVTDAMQGIAALLQRNPKLIDEVQGMLSIDDQDIIDVTCEQTGVGPPNDITRGG